MMVKRCNTSTRQASVDRRQTMYLLYSDLNGSLADYSFGSEVPHATEGPLCDDVNVSEETGEAGAFARLTSFLRNLISSPSRTSGPPVEASDSPILFHRA